MGRTFLQKNTPDEALAMAFEMRGKDARVVVIPDGVSVMVTAPEEGKTE